MQNNLSRARHDYLKHIIAIAAIAALGGCVSAVSDSAICDATERDRTAHAAALALDGGPQSVVTGARLIARLDEGCK